MKYSQAALAACIATGTLTLGVSARPHFHSHFSAPSERDGEISVAPPMARTLTPHHIYLVREYLDEVDARGFRDMVRGARQNHKEKKAQKLQAKADKAAAKAGGGAGGDVSERDLLFADDELEARLFDKFRQNYRQAKADRLQRKADKAAAKAGGGASAGGDVSARALDDFEDDVLARELEDELEARLFDKFRQNYRQAKADRLQRKADKAAAKAGGGASAGGDTAARSIDDLEDDLLARDLDNELEARLFDKFRQNYRQAKADRLQRKADKAAAKAGGGAGGEAAARDLSFDDATVEARSFMDMVRGARNQRKAGKAERLQVQADLAAGKAAAAATRRSLWDFGSMEDLD